MEPIRVLLASAHALYRAGLRAILEGRAGIQVVAETGSGKEVLRRVEEARPNVVVVDAALPETNGLDLTARVTQERPDVRVIILAEHHDEHGVIEALRAGAVAWVLKGETPVAFEAAVRAVARGENYFSPPVEKTIEDCLFRRSKSDRRGHLTPQEQKILGLIADLRTPKEIAHHLGTTAKTVYTHRAALVRKLGVGDATGLLRYAVTSGLSSPPL